MLVSCASFPGGTTEMQRANITIPKAVHQSAVRFCEENGIPFSALVSLLLRLFLKKDHKEFINGLEEFQRCLQLIRPSNKKP